MMLDAVRGVVQAAGQDLRLLDHPFYRRWSAGEVTLDELASYAGQYRHFEVVLPRLLTQITEAVADTDVGALVARNLRDEAGSTPTHVELFDQFLAGVGGTRDAPASPATAELVNTYHEAAAAGPRACLAAIAAYEIQASAVASTKAAGLRHRYGLDDQTVMFWDVHAELDAQHAEWAVEAVALLDAAAAHRGGADGVPDAPGRPGAVERWAKRASQAWWAFLDERQARWVGSGAASVAC